MLPVRGFFSLPKSVLRKILVFFSDLLWTKTFFFLIDVKIMKACAKEIILKLRKYLWNKNYSWYIYLETGQFMDSTESFSLAS